MRRWQPVLVATLLLLPILAIAGFGAWQLWQSGWWFWLAWSLPVCWGLGWFLARRLEGAATDSVARDAETALDAPG